MTRHAVAILGAGPAGMTAALQLRRSKIPFVLLEGERVGGLLWNAERVENYLGFASITGEDLIRRFEEHLAAQGVCVCIERVEKVGWKDDSFQIETTKGRREAARLVVATGTQAVPFPKEVIALARPESVVYEVSALRDRSGQRIAIIGAGDAAFDFALTLSKKNEVFVFNRGERIKALPALEERVWAAPSIHYYAKTALHRALSQGDGGLLLHMGGPDRTWAMDVDLLVGAMGRRPRLDFFEAALLAQKDDLMKERRLFFAGDVHRGRLRQTALATADGLQAAMTIEQQLRQTALATADGLQAAMAIEQQQRKGQKP